MNCAERPPTVVRWAVRKARIFQPFPSNEVVVAHLADEEASAQRNADAHEILISGGDMQALAQRRTRQINKTIHQPLPSVPWKMFTDGDAKLPSW